MPIIKIMGVEITERDAQRNLRRLRMSGRKSKAARRVITITKSKIST